MKIIVTLSDVETLILCKVSSIVAGTWGRVQYMLASIISN